MDYTLIAVNTTGYNNKRDVIVVNMPDNKEPIVTVEVGDNQITILGTAHVSKASAETVKTLLASNEYQSVSLELCPSRHNAMVNPDALAKMDLFKVLREGKAPMVMASLALGAYQQRMAEQFGIEPGAEMRTAIQSAEEKKMPVQLIDREIGTTLKRIYRNIPWWRRLNLFTGLMFSIVSREEVSEKEIESLKEGDILESTFSQFAEQAQDLYKPLIDERDQYMAARLLEDIAGKTQHHVLAVVGAGHMKGMQNYLEQYQPAMAENPGQIKQVIEQLDNIPVGSRWLKLIPGVIVAVILLGFLIGFNRSSDLGMELVVDWVVINGGLAALGALIALAHPVTIFVAFIAAPLTSLNPMVGAGMVTAAVETFMRKPSVGDFGKLRADTTSLKGWWRNRVTRVLLVFLLSTLGSVFGTYIAGFRIFEKLMSS